MNRRDLWQKLSIDWPCAVTDWIYANTVPPLRASLKQLTLRRLIYMAAFIVAATAFAQIAAGEVVLLMAGDIALYAEIASAVYLITARAHLRQFLAVARQRLIPVRTRIVRRMRRAIRVPVRRMDDGGNTEDGPAGAYAFA